MMIVDPLNKKNIAIKECFGSSHTRKISLLTTRILNREYPNTLDLSSLQLSKLSIDPHKDLFKYDSLQVSHEAHSWQFITTSIYIYIDVSTTPSWGFIHPTPSYMYIVSSINRHLVDKSKEEINLVILVLTQMFNGIINESLIFLIDKLQFLSSIYIT